MSQRIATCSCGNVRVTCSGEPFRISMCHCVACQRRSGAPFGAQSWFQRDQLNNTRTSTVYAGTIDSGIDVTFQYLCKVRLDGLLGVAQ